MTLIWSLGLCTVQTSDKFLYNDVLWVDKTFKHKTCFMFFSFPDLFFTFHAYTVCICAAYLHVSWTGQRNKSKISFHGGRKLCPAKRVECAGDVTG